MEQISKKEKGELDSNSLSVRLMNAVTGTTLTSVTQGKSITSLKGLSNRLKNVNQVHRDKHVMRGSTSEWINKAGIDLEKLTDIGKKTKILSHQSAIRQRPIEQKASPIQISFKDLSYQEFALKSEEKIAYFGLFQSLNQRKRANNAKSRRANNMKAIIRQNYSSLSGARLEQQKMAIRKNSKERAINEELQAIEEFGSCISQSQIDDMHNHFCERLYKQKYEDYEWMVVLSNQIQIASMIHSMASVDSGQILPKNYLATVTIDALEQIYNNFYSKDEKSELINQYASSEQNYKWKLWSDLYVLLRKGAKNEFMRLLSNEDTHNLTEHYDNLLQQLGQFQRTAFLHDVNVNKQCNIFERMLKLIIMGKFQKLFNDNLRVRVLEEPWLLLMTLGLKRQGANLPQQKLRRRQLDEAATSYFNTISSELYKSQQLCDQLIAPFIVGLLSLGCYNELFILYDELKRRGYILNSTLNVNFIHIFFTLAANPVLLGLQFNQSEASNFISRCLQKLVDYLKYLKKKNTLLFKIYFTQIIAIISKSYSQIGTFPYQRVIRQICQSLIVSFDDLNLIDHEVLKNLESTNGVVKYFQKEVIKNINPSNEEEYIELATFCDSIDQIALQKEILIKLLVKNYYSIEKEEREEEGGLQWNYNRQVSPSNSQYVRIAELFLKEELEGPKLEFFKFISELKEMRQYIKQRRTDRLRECEQRLSRFRYNHKTILKGIMELDPENEGNYLDIFISYYQKLEQMYQIIYISSSSITSYQRERATLFQQLKDLGQNHPQIAASNQYKKICSMLKK